MAASPNILSRAHAADPTAPLRGLVVLAIEGDLRYLSHHDEMRMLTRALRRADWPLAYSQGYNPQVRVALPLPRNVGTASRAEYALIGMTESRPARRLFESLGAAMPGGCRLLHVSLPVPRGAPQATAVQYSLTLDAGDAAGVPERVREILASRVWTVRRERGPDKPAKDLDIRPLVEDLRLDGRVLVMRLRFERQRTARAKEILELLHLPAAKYAHRVCRDEVEWNMPLVGTDAWPTTERMQLDCKQKDKQASIEAT
jgi:radical SAM-linked protein